MGKVLGIDYGAIRTGIAITDNMQIIASGLTTVATHNLYSFYNLYNIIPVLYCFEDIYSIYSIYNMIQHSLISILFKLLIISV